MESGFRKFWRRKKNKGATDLQAQPGDGKGSQPRPSFSTLGDSRPSTSLLRQYDRRDSQDRVASPRDYVSITSGEFSRPKSRNRIQPILIGISRPADLAKRPGTAGSIYSAVQQAADTAHERPSQDLRRNAVLKQAHERSGSNRSVDIFAVATSLPNRSSRFNEEVALRNLDTLQAAGQLPDGASGYVPTSRYQEEVAVRNAGSLYSGRSSFDQSRGAETPDRTASLTSRNERSSSSPAPVVSHSHRPLQEASSSPYRASTEVPAHHSRQHNQRVRDHTKPLPPILQDDVEDDNPRRLPKIQTSPVLLKAQVRPSSRGLGDSSNFIHGVPSIVQGNDRTQSSHTRQYSDLSRPNTAGSIANRNQMSSIGSGLDPPARHPGRLIVPNSTPSQYTHERQDSMDTSSKSNSLFSASGARRTSGSRAIMDLTNEDAYSETSSMYGYSQYSPVLEHANSGSMQRSYPVHASPYGKLLSKDTLPISNGIARSPALVQPEYTHLSEGHTATISDGENSPVVQDVSPSQIAFSPINTLASWSPRNSAFYPQPGDEPTARATVPPVLAKEPHNHYKLPSLPVQPQTGSLVSQRQASVNEATKPIDHVAGHSDLATLPPEEMAKTSLSTRTSPTPLISLSTSAVHPAQKLKRPVKEWQATAVASESTSVNAKAGPAHIQHQALKSADGLRPADYVDLSHASGVLTRDFALSPRKSTSSLKKSDPQALHRAVAEKSLGGNADGGRAEVGRAEVGRAESRNQDDKGQTPRKTSKSRAKSSASQSKKFSPGFDEEAFARKQAEAKAALLRLQQSLQEDFEAMPLPKAPKKIKRRTEQVAVVQPTAHALTTSETRRPSTSDSNSWRGDSRAPPTSFRSIVSGPERSSSMSSARSRSGGKTPRKEAPPALKNVAAASSPINPSLLPPSLQMILQTSNRPPRSPGDISLSSFPLPSSRPSSEHEPVASPSGSSRPAHIRRGSSKSQVSVASQFSIPFHMIPDRSSSVRDTLTEEED